MFTSRIVASILSASLCASLGARPSLAQPPQAPLATQEAYQLAPAFPVERGLTGGESHTYRLAIAAGQFLRIEVEQRGVDVTITLSDRDGRQVAASDLPHAGVEWVSLIAHRDTELRLEIRAANRDAAAAQAGRYAVKLAELRAATEPDRQRVAADRALTAGERLRAQESAEARRGAVGKYEEALALYRAASDRRGESFAGSPASQAGTDAQPALRLALLLGAVRADRRAEIGVMEVIGAMRVMG